VAGIQDAIALDEFERSLLVPRIRKFIDAAPDDDTRAGFSELAHAVESGTIAAHLQSRLGAIVDVALTSGIVRRESGPAAANTLAALHRRTPQGRLIGASVDSINNALRALEGHTIQSISASLRSPGVYTISIRTSQLETVISLASSGAAVESLEVAID
jgi:hypothetical protein